MFIMGRKSIIKPFKALDSVDISSSQNSVSMNLESIDKAVIHIEWAGTSPVGVLTVQSRMDDKSSWIDVDMGNTINISGNTGSHVLLFNEKPAPEIRLSYAATSGVGIMTATLSGNVTGA